MTETLRKPRGSIKLPCPLPHQLAILMSPAQYKVAVCGRKFGKTTMCLTAVVDGHGPIQADGSPLWKGAARGKKGLWTAPTSGHCDDIWRILKEAVQDAWTAKTEQPRWIEFPGGGSITVKSGDDPNSLRGPNYDFIVIDECAFCAEAVWSNACAPTLAATNGWVVFISTPFGLNWFYKLYRDAEKLPLEMWERWQRPTSDNSLVTREFLENERRTQPSVVFSQEYLAEFTSNSAGLFKDANLKRYRREGKWVLLEGERYTVNSMVRFATVDTATSEKTTHDFSVVAVWGVTPVVPQKLVLLDLAMDHVDAAGIIRMITTICRTHDCIPHIEDSTASKHLLSFMETQGIVFRRVSHGSQDKVTRASEAIALCEQGRLVFPEKDLEAYPWLSEVEHQLFAFPPPKKSKVHDDAVDCVAYAARIMLRDSGWGFGDGAPDGKRPPDDPLDDLFDGYAVPRPPGF